MNKKNIFLLLIGVLVITGCIFNGTNGSYEKDGICIKEYSKSWTTGDVYIYLQEHSTLPEKPNVCRKINIPKANILSFKIIAYPYSKDKNNVYYYQDKINDANAKTFQVVGGILSKDDINVYAATQKIMGADTETIEIVDDFDQYRDFYVKDANYVYYFFQNGLNKIIDKADSKTFEFLNSNYAKDKNYVYCRQRSIGKISKLEGADVDTFEILSQRSAKDKNNFYERCDIESSLEAEEQGEIDYSVQAFMECVECVNNKTWNNKPCCTDNFESECLAENGVVRWSDLHPAFTVLYGCFQKAPDTGEECASGIDCMSGVCNLENAIQSNKCALTKKELTGDENQYGDERFYIATYSCIINKPGECTETIENRKNPGGVYHNFKMEGNV